MKKILINCMFRFTVFSPKRDAMYVVPPYLYRYLKYQPTMPAIDVNEMLRRLFKYLTMGAALSLCSLVLVKRRMNMDEIVLLGGCAGALFAVVDIALPAVAPHLNQGK